MRYEKNCARDHRETTRIRLITLRLPKKNRHLQYKYKQVYKWLDINNINWHIYKRRKSNLECSQIKQTSMNTDPPNKQSNTSAEPPQDLEMVCD